MTNSLPRFAFSSIYSQAPATQANDQRNDEVHRKASAAWHKRGLALINPADVDDDFARQAIINEANRLYGRRR